MKSEAVMKILETYGEQVEGKVACVGQIVTRGGQAFNAPFSPWEHSPQEYLRLRVAVLPQGMDPRDPQAHEHAKVNDVILSIEEVAAIMVPAKVSALSAPDGRKIVLS